MRKLTQEQFIEECNKVHNYKYDYSKAVYVNKRTKITILCPIHGEFEQVANNHKRGQGCPVCGKEYAKSYHTGNYQLFLKNADEKFGECYEYPYIVDEYYNKNSIITAVCTNCGTIIKKRAFDFLQSEHGYCLCYRKVCYKHENLNKICPENKVKYFDGVKYLTDKITLICDKHGEFERSVKEFVKGRTCCVKCNAENYVSPKRLTQQVYIQRLHEKFGDVVDILTEGDFNSSDLVWFRCKKCGHRFRRSFNLFLFRVKHACPNCAKIENSLKRTKTIEQFIEDVNKVYPNNEYDYSETVYKSSCEKVLIKCNDCGRTFEIEANSFLRGHGCPYHNRNSSLMEKEIVNFINECGFVTKTNDRSILKGKELDILIPSINTAIEFDGLFWHCNSVKPNDYHLMKTKRCIENGIRLIHVFEDEWKFKSNICKSLLFDVIGKTELYETTDKLEISILEEDVTSVFLETNDLNGKTTEELSYGLSVNSEICHVMCFVTCPNNIYKISRNTHALYKRFPNAEKLILDKFIEDNKPSKILAYSDRRWYDGNEWLKLDFTYSHTIEPIYFVVNFDKRIKTKANENDRLIYDCGYNVYEYKL